MKLSIIDLKGKAAGEHEVKFEVIANGIGTQAVHDTVTAQRAAQRAGTACTKTVGDVAGTNKKPWRQKGTGRARAGSFRSPLWRGGGVVFGPKPRDFSKKVNIKTKKLAFRKALSERINAGDIVIVENLSVSTHKTKEVVALLQGLNLDGTVTLISESYDKTLLAASRNIPYVDLITADLLNTYDVLKNDKLVFSKAAFAKVEERLTKE
jgi:large subunit ribosomal protein L4